MDEQTMNFGLDILTHTGLHPFLNRLREKIILAVWMFFSFFSLAVCCVGMKDADFSNIPLLSKKIEGFIIHLKVYSKTYILVKYRTSLINLINSRRSFWKLDDCGDEMKNQSNATFQKLLKLLKVFKYTCYVTTILTCVAPYLMNDGTPLTAWVPNGIPYAYESLYIIHVLLYLIAFAPLTVAFDCIFASICFQIIVQLRMVQQRLKNIEFNFGDNGFKKEECIRKIKECVKHHVFLLRYIKEVESYYKLYILIQYINAIALMCPELYIATINGVSTDQITKALLVTILVMSEVAIFCFLAEEIKIECENVGDAAYDCKWQTVLDRDISFCIRMIMGRSTIPVNLTGGGLFIADKANFVLTIKTGFSFFTAMKSFD